MEPTQSLSEPWDGQPTVFRLSFSAFECYSQCPLKFKTQYIDKVRTANNEYAMYGSAFHTLLETTYTTEEFILEKMVEIWPAIFDNEAGKKPYDSITKAKKAFQQKRGLTDIRTWFSMASREGLLRPALAREIKLEGNFKKHTLVAKIDLVIPVRGAIGIIDWKTGNADRKNLMQLALYAMLYFKKTGQKIDWLIPFYTKIKEVVYQPFDEAIVKEAGEYFGKTYNALVADKEFLPIKGTHCFFCDFGKEGICPLGNKRKKTTIII